MLYVILYLKKWLVLHSQIYENLEKNHLIRKCDKGIPCKCELVIGTQLAHKKKIVSKSQFQNADNVDKINIERILWHNQNFRMWTKSTCKKNF